MRLGTFNVENLFDRAAAMNLPTWAEGKPILEDFKRLNDLIGKETYTNADKQEMHTIMGRHKGLLTQDKSKGFGVSAAANTKRKRQAQRVHDIYEERLQEGVDLIAVVGDLNDTPDSDPLTPLVTNGSTLVDVMAHPKFVGDGRLGTHGNGTKSGKLDYLLMSPKLAATVEKAGIERRGAWGGKNGTLFPHLPEIKSAKDAASDHAALWVELDI